MYDHTDCMAGLAATLETYTDEQRAARFSRDEALCRASEAVNQIKFNSRTFAAEHALRGTFR